MKFNCTSDEEPVWKYRNGPLKPNMQTGQTQDGSYWLKITNVQPQHEGNYTCTSEKYNTLFVGKGRLSITRN